MNLRRPTLARVLLLGLLLVVTFASPAAPALAHNGTGGAASDYRIDITSYSGDHDGIELRVVELGNRVELRRTSASVVMVLGYEGEPYLRFDADGVYENENSPAHYLDLDRFAATDPPATATATATPAWHQVASGTVFRWHDHRAHWMSPVPPDDVLADPDVEHLVRTDAIAMQIDGRRVDATVAVTWLPKPDKVIWYVAAVALGAAVAAAFVLVRGADRFIPVTALAASLAALVDAGGSSPRLVLAVLAVALAVVALVMHKRLLAVAAAAIVGLLAATRIDVFDHQLLAGWGSGTVQRVAAVLALGLGLGTVAAAIVTALSPSSPPAPIPGSSDD